MTDTEMFCPDGLVYDMYADKCDYPENVEVREREREREREEFAWVVESDLYYTYTELYVQHVLLHITY